MEKVSEFLVNNYIWFLVGVIVLVFALIGYLVDAKNKKMLASGEIIPRKEKKVKSKEDLTKESVSEMEDMPIGDAMKPKNKKKEETKEEPKEVPKTEANVTYDEPIIKEETPSEDSFEVDEK